MWLCENCSAPPTPQCRVRYRIAAQVALASPRGGPHAGAPILPAAADLAHLRPGPATSATSMVVGTLRFARHAFRIAVLQTGQRIRFRDRERVVDLAAALLLALAAMLSKEIGLDAVAARTVCGALVHIALPTMSGADRLCLALFTAGFFPLAMERVGNGCPAALPAPFRTSQRLWSGDTPGPAGTRLFVVPQACARMRGSSFCPSPARSWRMHPRMPNARSHFHATE